MISVSHLEKTFGDKRVLKDLSFEIRKGEVVGFLGPNGAGKTTTMRILTGYLDSTHGAVHIDGKDVADHAFLVRKKIGYLPENNPLYETMRVYEYLEFVSRIKGIERIREEVQRVTHIVHVEEYIASEISELSKGYRQRVGLADALLGNPEILILDEPTSGLDPNQAQEIRTLIREIGKTKTVLFSTHILHEVETSCDRALIIHNGALVAEGTVAELSRTAKGTSEVLLKIEGSKENILNFLLRLPDVQDVKSDRDEEYSVVSKADQETLCREISLGCSQNGWALLRMQTREVSLEDVFRQLTK